MAGAANNVMRLLLFSLICVKGKDGLIFRERGFKIVFPCEEDLVCLQEWPFGTRKISDYFATVINGEMQGSKSKYDDSKCVLQIRDLRDVVGGHFCLKSPDVFSPNTNSAMPDFTLMPGKSMSMQCILLQKGRCVTQFLWVTLVWLDEDGAEVRGDSQHQIERKSRCDTTLTVTFQSPVYKKYQCQATMGGQSWISEELWVRVSGVKGEDGLIFPGRGYGIVFQCEKDLVCLQEWFFSTQTLSDYIAIVINGEMQESKSEYDDSKCVLKIRDLTEVVGRHRCRKSPDVFSPNTNSAMPDFTLMPGKSMSMQCILLQQGRCATEWWSVKLVWLDEAGTEVRGDAEHQIEQKSRCDTTLTVTFQSPGNKKYRCQATVTGEVRTSEELWVRVSAPKGKGRGLTIDPQPENPNQGGEWSTVGVAVRLAACVMLMALVVGFIVRRRMSHQRPDESHAADNDPSADDVVYENVTLQDVSGQVGTMSLLNTPA